MPIKIGLDTYFSIKGGFNPPFILYENLRYVGTNSLFAGIKSLTKWIKMVLYYLISTANNLKLILWRNVK